MGPHDHLTAKWRDYVRVNDGVDVDIFDPHRLRPGNFCAYYSVDVNSPVGCFGGWVIMDSPADFVAFLRHALVSDELCVGSSVEPGYSARGRGAEASLDKLDSVQRLLAEDCLNVMDGILEKGEIDRDDAERAIAAFNVTMRFPPERYSSFETWGGVRQVAAQLAKKRIARDDDEIEAACATYDDDEEARRCRGELLVERMLVELTTSGTFDGQNPVHVRLVRDVLWLDPRDDCIELQWEPDWDWYISTRFDDPPGPAWPT